MGSPAKFLKNNRDIVFKYQSWNYQSLRNLTARVSVKENSEIEWLEAKPVETIPGPKPLPIPYGNAWRFSPFGK